MNGFGSQFRTCGDIWETSIRINEHAFLDCTEQSLARPLAEKERNIERNCYERTTLGLLCVRLHTTSVDIR